VAEITKHLRRSVLEAYVTRTLLPRELIEADEHLAICDDCLDIVRALMNVAGTYGDMQVELEAGHFEPPAHLSYKVIESYVDGLLTRRKRDAVEAHAKDCPVCAEAIAALLKFKDICNPPASE
jgi:predicted anti-sigma-YlaC factor YlaD